jgi:hypothetical protein
MTTSGPRLVFEPKVKLTKVAGVTEPNARPAGTISGAVRPGQVAFHNPSPAGGAQARPITRTECLGLPVPAQGSRF